MLPILARSPLDAGRRWVKVVGPQRWFTMALTDAVRAEIEAQLKKSPVVLFMKGNKHFPQCGFSSQVVSILTELGAPFSTVNVLSDPGIREGIKEYTNWPTIPQLYVNGEFVGGCDIVKELHGTGELAKMLGVTQKEVKAPSITIHPDAAKAILAADEGEGDKLRLEIDGDFHYDLFFGPKSNGDFEVISNGVTLLIDRASAARADGLSITWVESSEGGAFKIENPNEPPRVKPLSAEMLKGMLDKKEPLRLIDVRSEAEREIAKIEGAVLLTPEVEGDILELPKDTVLVFQCHHGVRSRNAAERFLREGFQRIYNLEGGIDAWSQKVDPTVKRY